MREIHEAGSYRGFVEERGFSETRNGCCQLHVKAGVEEQWADGGWFQLPEPLEVQGWLILTKKNGKKNKAQVKALMEAFGWDGHTLKGLRDCMHPQHLVVFNMKEEEDQHGDIRIGLAWINSASWTPGFGVADGERFDQLDMAFQGKAANCAPPPDELPPDELPPDDQIPF